MRLRHLFIATLFAVTPLMFTACDDDDDDDVTTKEETSSSSFSLSSSSLTFDASASSQTITVSGATTVSTSSDSWITVSSSQSSDGTISLKITVSYNSTGASRTGSITVVTNLGSTTVTVEQSSETTSTSTTEETSLTGLAAELYEKLGMGWNLGNQMDSYSNGVSSETVWGNPVCTQALFTALKAAGFSSVRIPVTWMGHIGDAPDYTIETAWMDRVAEIVGYAETAGLNAIVNIHHDGANSEFWLDVYGASTNSTTKETVLAEFTAVWQQIAERFKDSGDFLMFESCNEVQDGSWGWGKNLSDGGAQYAVLNEWNQSFVTTVRATGSNNASRLLGVPGYSTDIDLTLSYLDLPSDPANRTVVAVHYYAPNNYTLEANYDVWGKDNGGSYASDCNEDYMASQFAKVKAAYADNGLAAYIGEFGCVRRSTDTAEANRIYYLETLASTCKTYGLPALYWDNGVFSAGRECSGLFNRETGEYVNNAEEVVAAMAAKF